MWGVDGGHEGAGGRRFCVLNYPDVVVTCHPQDLAPDAQKDYVEAPTLLLEVLSDSTEPVDRLEKLLPYRRLPSLHKYALINQNKP
jgi:Uma2 family endonuclease